MAARRRPRRAERAARLNTDEKRAVRSARDQGATRAAQALAKVKTHARIRSALANRGALIAEGDSWFHYPFHDVLKELKDLGYRIESAAHWGDNVENMAFDPSQNADLAEEFYEVSKKGIVPRAILLSGGGNDMAGDELGVLLNHSLSGLAELNAKVVDGVLADRVLHAFAHLIGFVTELSRNCFGTEVRILVHGYGYAVPDGRGHWGGGPFFPGPWLEPGFRKKGYDRMADRIRVMADLIDRFNGLLAALPTQPGFAHVRYVNLRPVLPNTGNYQKWWANELHPTEAGFQAVAQKFDAAIVGP
jgi:hypothetical protein